LEKKSEFPSSKWKAITVGITILVYLILAVFAPKAKYLRKVLQTHLKSVVGKGTNSYFLIELFKRN